MDSATFFALGSEYFTAYFYLQVCDASEKYSLLSFTIKILSEGL